MLNTGTLRGWQAFRDLPFLKEESNLPTFPQKPVIQMIVKCPKVVRRCSTHKEAEARGYQELKLIIGYKMRLYLQNVSLKKKKSLICKCT